mmetsp:Transcript_15714/g.66207  ORF Transcript_15714/g.66207 Transcript_15714/m.66207 type:complete len:232 (+) Transcript_15714:2975-3670(+)
MPDKAKSVLTAEAKKGDLFPPRSHRRAAFLCDKSMRRSLHGRANSLCFAASSAGWNESAAGRYVRSSCSFGGPAEVSPRREERLRTSFSSSSEFREIEKSKRVPSVNASSRSKREEVFGGCLPTTHRSSVFAVAKSSASRMESTATTGAAPKSCTVTRSRHRHTVVRRDAYAVNAREAPARSPSDPKRSAAPSPKRSGVVGDAATYAASGNSSRRVRDGARPSPSDRETSP